MQNNEIAILCNSSECLAEISSGRWPNISKMDLFTCNLAYSHFRTAGRHFNMFTDPLPIVNFISHPNWYEVYDTYLYKNVQFVINTCEIQKNDITLKRHESCKADICFCPISIPASSAIGALFHSALLRYKVIHLIGYTINEWEGIEAVKELEAKHKTFQWLNELYTIQINSPFVYTYKLKLKTHEQV